jgi:hypothetical protein
MTMTRSRPDALVEKGLSRYVTNLRYPWLLALTAIVFAADLVVPDAIPFVDEILLGLVTALLASLRRRKTSQPGRTSRDGDST